MPSGGRTGTSKPGGTPGGPRTALPALKQPRTTPSASESGDGGGGGSTTRREDLASWAST